MDKLQHIMMSVPRKKRTLQTNSNNIVNLIGNHIVDNNNY